MPAVDGHPGRDVALDGLNRVQGDGRVGHQRPAGLEQQPLARARSPRAGRRRSLHVLLGARWMLVGRVGGAEAAAEVVDLEVTQAGDRPHRGAERLELEQLRADVEVQPHELERSGCRASRAIASRGLAPSRSRTSSPPGRWRPWRACPGHVGRDPEQHLLTGGRSSAAIALQPLELVEGVEDDVADAGRRAPRAARRPTWRCRAGRSARGQSPPPGPGPARRPRPRRRPGPPRPGSGTRRCRGTPWRRTGRRSRRGAAATALTKAARPGAQVVLDDDVGRGAEFPGQLERVASAELEVAGGVDPRAEREGRGASAVCGAVLTAGKDMLWAVRARS